MNFRLNRARALSTACLAIAAATTAARATSGTVTLYTDQGDPWYIPADIAPYAYYPAGAFTAIINSGTVIECHRGQRLQFQCLDHKWAVDRWRCLCGGIRDCVETLVNFDAAVTYDYSVGLNLQQPALYGSSTGDTGLTEGVAWLYQQYATGKLATDLSSSPYNSQSFSYTSNESAAALQYAIWELEKETPNFAGNNPTTQPSMTLGSAGLGTDLIDLAEKAVDPTSVTVGTTTAYTDAQTLVTMSNAATWDVYVLELTTNNGTPAQDQLIYGPASCARWRENDRPVRNCAAGACLLPPPRRPSGVAGRVPMSE